MRRNVLNVLNEAYPSPAPIPKNLTRSFLFGLFVAIFLIFFEPFDIDLGTENNTIPALLFYGCISALVVCFFMYVLPLLFTNYFSDNRWKVKHQILYCILMLISISTLNGIYANYRNALDFSWMNYWWIINRTFMLGAIPFSFLILWDFRQKSKQHTKIAEDIQTVSKSISAIPPQAANSIRTELKNTSFVITDNTFSHAVAAGNYIDIFEYTDGKIRKSTYRLSMSSFEEQITLTRLLRCHRSYMINLKKVVQVSGNAQGLKITLDGYPEQIPVSRKYIPIIRDYYQKL